MYLKEPEQHQDPPLPGVLAPLFNEEGRKGVLVENAALLEFSIYCEIWMEHKREAVLITQPLE